MRINSIIWMDINFALPTVEDMACSCGICGGQCDTGTHFSPRIFNFCCWCQSTDVSCSYFIHLPSV